MNALSKYLSLLFPLLAITVSSSCIKEQRAACPCTLIINLEEVDSLRFIPLIAELEVSGGFSGMKTIRSVGRPFVVRVPKGIAHIAVYHVEHGPGFPDDELESCLTVEEGQEFPQLWLHASTLDTRAELKYDTVRLHKSFCRLDVRLTSGSTPVRYGVRIDGRVCGYAADGSPADGLFGVALRPDDAGCCSVRVPRQKDASLALSLVDETDVLRRFAIGEYIVRSGYDWTAPDLEDIEVTIDFSRSVLDLRTEKWGHGYVYSVEI